MKTKQKTGDKATAQGRVPKLRFPEFQDAGAWVETTIGDIGSFYYGKSAPKWSLEEDAPTRCVRYGELYTKFSAIITETYSRTNIDPIKLRFNKGGEILVPRVGEKPEEFGKCCCYLPLGNIAIGEMISVFETVQNPVFYTYYFRNLYRQFAKVVEGQNVKNLYYAELEPLPIHRPPLPEQQKIADCLTSIDELITAQAKKLETLKAHKKGLMQQLFPAEGETVPKLRFPEFRDAGAWEEKRLGEIGGFMGGGTPSKKKDSYWSGNNPWISSSDISEDSILQIAISRYITTQAIQESATKIVPANSILLVSRVGVGKLAITTKPICTSQDFTNFTPAEDNFVFLAYYLKSHKEEFLAFNQGMAIKGFTKNDIKGLRILLPFHKKEQQKIANCLTSIDNLITAQTKKLDTLKAHKKGLMQQLFPAPDEVYG